MNAITDKNNSINPSIAARSIEYGVRQIARSPEIAASQIFPGLAQSIDHKPAIFALVSRDGQPNIKFDASVNQHIEKSLLAEQPKEFLRALYYYVTKENQIEAVPNLALKAQNAGLPHVAFDLAVYFFSKIKSSNLVHKSEPIIVALEVIGKNNPFASEANETFQFQRALENAVSIATVISQSYFSDDSRLKAAIRNTHAIITTARISGAKPNADQSEGTAYDVPKAFDYNGAIQRLRQNPTETNLLPIEEALQKAKVKDRIKVMQKALECFSGDQITAPIKRRITDLKIMVDERKIAELDLDLSKAADGGKQQERDQLAHQLYELKVSEYQERLAANQDDIKLRMQISEAYRLEGEVSQAIQVLQKGSANTMDGKQRKIYHVMLGDLFTATDNHRIALRAYEVAVGVSKPEELALQPNSFEFSALVKMIGSLVKLKSGPDGEKFSQRALELLEPIYLHSSEINSEIKDLYEQVSVN